MEVLQIRKGSRREEEEEEEGGSGASGGPLTIGVSLKTDFFLPLS